MVAALLTPDITDPVEPDEQAKQQSRRLVQCIAAACGNAGGWLRFSQFMNMALYQPGLGYYSGGLQKFGEAGDFITAPEVSPLFGQCLARQLAEILQSFHAEKTTLLEFGAGSGTLAVDILLRLEQLGALPDRYLIMELSAELVHRQQQLIKQRIPHLSGLVSWLEQLPDAVDNAVVIANEVLDAMPVECFRIKNRKTGEAELRMVGVEKGALVARYMPADEHTTTLLETIRQRSAVEFADGYQSEYNPAIRGWLSALAEKIGRMVLLLIDYGYPEAELYHADRAMGSLLCYYRHRAHADYLRWPGLQDITSFVNFTDIAYSAAELGMEVSGYTTQAAFLLGCGLAELHADQVSDDVQQQVKLSQQIKTLTLPSEMGERFKVMALTRNYDGALTAFSMLDLRNRL